MSMLSKSTARRLLKITAIGLALAFYIWACTGDSRHAPIEKFKKETTAHRQFVGAQTCQSCHQKEFNDWSGSHHDQAMKVANADNIAGDFNNAQFESNGVNFRFFRKGNKFLVNTQDGDGQYKDFEIVHTFGITPLQQYLVAFPDGSMQCIQVAWDTEKEQWFDLQPDLKIATEEWLHWTRGAMRWNTMCADCHSTDVRKNFDSQKEIYNTTYAEINVACESCHGPGKKHVEFYQTVGEGSVPQLYMHNAMTSTEMVDKCARCHARRGQITSHFDYSGTFLDHYRPALITDQHYELDGQIDDEDYVYASFIQSKMYHNNVACRDCHDSHTLKLKAEGNALCMSCHEPKYDSFEHHFHFKDSESSQCINCHMTGKTYMGNDFRRDHSFRVPRPDQTVKYGTPNACNGCHNDQSAAWAADFIEARYGQDRPKHFSDLLLAGYHGDRPALMKLIGDPSFPAIARATGLHYIAQSLNQKELDAIKKYLKDSSALVRNQTATLIAQVDAGTMVPEMTDMLADEVRLVRITAAKYFNRINPSDGDQSVYMKAARENRAAMQMEADFPGGQHALALHYEANGNILAAIEAYRKAIEIDNYYNQARMNLALLLYRQGNGTEAEKLYLKVTEQESEFGDAWYMLGLLYHEKGNNEKAITYLAEACQKNPPNDRAFYNYALILQHVSRFEESIKVTRAADLHFPNHEQLVYVQLIAEMKLDLIDDAKLTCRRLLQLNPNNPSYRQLLNQLEVGS